MNSEYARTLTRQALGSTLPSDIADAIKNAAKDGRFECFLDRRLTFTEECKLIANGFSVSTFIVDGLEQDKIIWIHA